MKRTLLTTALVLITLICQAQESSMNNADKKIFYVLKAKLGISQLELLDSSNINGNITQVDFLLSSRISNKYRLEYGLGFSQFNGNNVYKNEYVDIKNNNFRLPINLIYNRDFKKNVSLIYGVGVYGIYYAKTDIKSYYEGSGAGINVGAGVQLGANFKISDDMSFKILAEVQRDITKIVKPNNIEIRERMNALLGLNFGYRF